MKALDCVREKDLVEAVATGRWPEGCDSDLRRHVAQCTICTDVAEVAFALRNDSLLARLEANVPSAGLVFWRAEMRARQEAARRAARPIGVARALAIASVAGVAVALGTWIDFSAVSAFVSAEFLPIAIALGIALAITPLALYFVFSDD